MTSDEDDESDVDRPRPVLLVNRHDMPRDEQRRVGDLVSAALAEVGYFPESHWDDEMHCYYLDPAVPEAVLWKAQRLALDSLGIAYEMRPREQKKAEPLTADAAS